MLHLGGVINSMKKTGKHKFKTGKNVEFELILRKPHKTHNADGLCDNPVIKNPKIYVNPHLLPRRKLAVLIEEIVHAHEFELSEKRVRKLSANLVKFIYLLGWRQH